MHPVREGSPHDPPPSQFARPNPREQQPGVHSPRNPRPAADPSPTILKRTKAPDCARSPREDIAINPDSERPNVTDDSGTIPQKRDRSTAPAVHRSEIERRADELRDVARACKTLNEFRAATGWNMETARHAREVLGLDLPDAKLRAGPPTAGQANPKQPKKGATK